MSDQNAGSATTQESSGSTENQSNDKVAYDTYKRVLSEAKKLKEQVKAFEEAQAKGNEQKLKDQNEWKQLAETKAAQVEDLEKKYNEQKQQIVNGMKYQEFEKQLGGKLKDREYATFIDFEKIVINPETQRIDAESVKGVVSDFVKKHSGLVEFTSARMPNQAPTTSSYGSKRPEEMSTLELENELKKMGNKL